jgi:hypothetical protein
MNPGQNYDAVQMAIQSLGKYAKLQFSLYYVHTALNAREAYNFVAAAMDSNDRLVVVDAIGGVVSSPQNVIDAINGVWFEAA